MNLKKMFTVALCGCLVLSSCGGDEAHPQVVISETTLVSYPQALIPATGEVVLPEVAIIADAVFEGATTLKTLKAPKLAKIGARAFKGATALVSVELASETLPETAAGAFEGTPANKNLIVPASYATTYRQWAEAHGFATINGLALTEYDPKITYDANGVLTKYPDEFIVDGVVSLPEAVTEVPASFFYNKNIVKVEGTNVIKIGSQVFQNCVNLTTVHLPKLSGEIPAQAFAQCSKLSEVTIGEEVTGALNDAFADTPRDKKLIISSTTFDREKHEKWAVEHGFKTLNGTTIELDIPEPLPAGFQNNERTITLAPQIPLNMTELVIPKYYQVLGNNCFKTNNSGGSYLRVLSGKGIKRIEDSALEGQTNIHTLNFPNLEYVGDNGVYTPSSLKRVDFPLCTEIGASSFEAGSQSELTEIILPSLKKWGRKAFQSHKKIARVRLGATPPELKASKYALPHSTTSPKPVLEVPVGSKAAYENWNGRTYFGEIVEYTPTAQ